MTIETQTERLVIYEDTEPLATIELFDAHVVEVTIHKFLCNAEGWDELSKAVSEAILKFNLEN